MPIHPTAIVDSNAILGTDVSVGPYAIIAAGATIGDGCEISGHAQILGNVQLGAGCRVGAGAILGGFPQDLSFDRATSSGVIIGSGCDLREHVTVHRASRAGCQTQVGNGNFFMVGSHVGHDCQVGDHNVFANHCLLGGHVQVGNHNFLGAGAGFHQFVRVGDRVMVQGLSAISLDLPPYVMAFGKNWVSGLNNVGLRRAGFNSETRNEIKELYKLFYRSTSLLQESLQRAAKRPWGPEADAFLEFLRSGTKKGINFRSSGKSRQKKLEL